MVLVVDPRGAGISGDMMLGALVDMGADGGAIVDGVSECVRLLDGSAIERMEFRAARRNGVRCTRLILETRDPPARPADQMAGAISDSAGRMGLSERAAAFARRSIERMISAEMRIHGVERDSVLLHEAASADTLVDIVGTAAALDDVGALDDLIITMPVNVGGGSVTFSHGTAPNPAPAVLEILKSAGIAMVGGAAQYETATPTGACILAGLGAVSRRSYPEMVAERTGYGGGSRDGDGAANVLVAVQGASAGSDSVCVLETNLDDVTGEAIGGAISEIMKAGALDAAAYPGLGKKGRASHLLRVLCEHSRANSITHVVVRQTGTLGVRVTTADRFVLPREERSITVRIRGSAYEFRYKTHSHMGETDFKVERDDIAAAAASSGVGARRVERLVGRRIDDDA